MANNILVDLMAGLQYYHCIFLSTGGENFVEFALFAKVLLRTLSAL